MKMLVYEYAYQSSAKFREKYKHNTIYECETYQEILDLALECNLYVALKKSSSSEYDYIVLVDTKMFHQR